MMTMQQFHDVALGLQNALRRKEALLATPYSSTTLRKIVEASRDIERLYKLYKEAIEALEGFNDAFEASVFASYEGATDVVVDCSNGDTRGIGIHIDMSAYYGQQQTTMDYDVHLNVRFKVHTSWFAYHRIFREIIQTWTFEGYDYASILFVAHREHPSLMFELGLKGDTENYSYGVLIQRGLHNSVWHASGIRRRGSIANLEDGDGDTALELKRRLDGQFDRMEQGVKHFLRTINL